jgi:hypothetical protein
MCEVFHVVKFRIHGGFPFAIRQALVTPSARHDDKQTKTMAGSLVGSTNQANFNEGLSRGHALRFKMVPQSRGAYHDNGSQLPMAMFILVLPSGGIQKL